MSEFSNRLTPAQAERLALLAEEMGEAQQVIGKILRHGYASVNPTVPRSATNRTNLEKEIGDAAVAVRLLVEAGDLNFDVIEGHAEKKTKSIQPWLHHQGKK